MFFFDFIEKTLGFFIEYFFNVFNTATLIFLLIFHHFENIDCIQYTMLRAAEVSEVPPEVSRNRRRSRDTAGGLEILPEVSR